MFKRDTQTPQVFERLGRYGNLAPASTGDDRVKPTEPEAGLKPGLHKLNARPLSINKVKDVLILVHENHVPSLAHNCPCGDKVASSKRLAETERSRGNLPSPAGHTKVVMSIRTKAHQSLRA